MDSRTKSAAYDFREPGLENFLYEFLNTRTGLELIKAFVGIRDPKVRRHIIKLVGTIAKHQDEWIKD